MLARYLDTHGRVMAVLRDRSLAPRAAVEGALCQSAAMQTGDGHPPGCLVVLATTVASPDNAHLQALLAAERDGNQAALRARVEEAIAAADLQAKTPASALATMFDSFLVGLTTQARDDVSHQALDEAVTQIMAVWNLHATGDRPEAQPIERR